ncbi:MAG: FecR domain-containing protein [Smithella sp.]
MKFFLLTVLIVIFFYSSPAHTEEQRAGIVKNVSGKAFIERNKTIKSVNVKDGLLEKDILITGHDGSMGVILQDNSVMSIGPNTRVIISKFLFNPAAEKLSFTAQVKKGTVVYLTGLIAKLNRNGVRFETPSSVCGIRGTHFAVKVEDNEDK